MKLVFSMGGKCLLRLSISFGSVAYYKPWRDHFSVRRHGWGIDFLQRVAAANRKGGEKLSEMWLWVKK